MIHRDLAARNCLLESVHGSMHKSTKQTINLRISDFGLSKHVEEHYGDIDIYK